MSLNVKSCQSYLYATLFVLLLSDFPLCLGYLPIGAFIPRLSLMFYAVITIQSVLKSKPVVLLLLYFAYRTIWQIADSGDFSLPVTIANYMEFAIPVMSFSTLMHCGTFKMHKNISVYVFCVSSIIMLATLNVSRTEPEIVRYMVGFSANGELALSNHYLRQGVCLYDFAAIMMLTPAMVVSIYKSNKHIFKVSQFLIIFAYFILALFFMYKAQVTTTMLLCVFTLLIILIIKNNVSTKNLLGIFLTLLVIMLIQDMVLPYISFLTTGTQFESRINEVALMASGGDIEGDSATRLDHYISSIKCFLHNPIFGSQTEIIGGHAYILDHLGRYGIVGSSLFFSFLYAAWKQCYSSLNTYFKSVYMILTLTVIVLGFLKNLAGLDYWLYLFFYIPCILKFAELSKNKNS